MPVFWVNRLITSKLNISQETIAPLNKEIRVEIQPEDFRPRVLEAIKKQGKKVQLPGFRPGMVPFGMIKKMIGKSVMADELNVILQEALNGFIKEENIRILGDPIPKNMLDGEDLDPDTEKTLEFVYEIGVSPDVEVNFQAGSPVEVLKIEVDEAFYLKSLEKEQFYHGKYENTEEYATGDTLVGSLVDLDEAGEIIEGSKNFMVLSAQRLDAKYFLPFEGKKLGDLVPLDIFEMEPDEDKLSSLFFLSPEAIEVLRGKTTYFQIDRIGHTTPHELTPEFFAKVLRLPEGETIPEEDFKVRYTEKLKNDVETEARNRLTADMNEWLLNNHPFDLPDDFLKRWLKQSNEKVTEEVIEKEYANYSENMKLQVLIGSLRRQFPDELNVDMEAFYDHVLETYGYVPNPENTPEQEKATRNAWLQEIFKQEERVNNLYNAHFEAKMTEFLQAKVPTVEKTLTATEFTTA